jgi:hypothetical protein
MAPQSISVPHVLGFDFGVGVDRLSGAPMNQVVSATPSAPTKAGGSTQSFEVSRIRSTRDLEKSLGINIEASYGCASFGAGASARFSYMQESRVHSSTLFMAVTATVHHAAESIDNAVLTEPAQALRDRQDLFATRYGDMFCRAQKRGGLLVGLMKVETFSSVEANEIEAELKGTYGFFSADVKMRFKSVVAQYNTATYCTVYAEGGPNIRIDDPTDPVALLSSVNDWKAAMYSKPDQYSVPYQWTLSEVAIAEGPLPPNAADIQNSQDVLTFCARERTTKLDQLNQLTWIYEHPDRFDWRGSVTQEQLVAAARNTQYDLDLLASCASSAINSPSKAVRPAAFASKQGQTYPAGTIPTPLPKERPPQGKKLSLAGMSPPSRLLFDVPQNFQATTELAVSLPTVSVAPPPGVEETRVAAGIGILVQTLTSRNYHGIGKSVDPNTGSRILGYLTGVEDWQFLWGGSGQEYFAETVHLRITFVNHVLRLEFSEDGTVWSQPRHTVDLPAQYYPGVPKLILFACAEPGRGYNAGFSKPLIESV